MSQKEIEKRIIYYCDRIIQVEEIQRRLNLQRAECEELIRENRKASRDLWKDWREKTSLSAISQMSAKERADMMKSLQENYKDFLKLIVQGKLLKKRQELLLTTHASFVKEAHNTKLYFAVLKK